MADVRSDKIKKNYTDFSSPLSIISATKQASLDIASLLEDKPNGSKYVSEESTADVIVRHSTLLGRLIPIRTDKERADKKSDPWDAKEAPKRLRFILEQLTAALRLLVFDPITQQQFTRKRLMQTKPSNNFEPVSQKSFHKKLGYICLRSDHHTSFQLC